MQAMAMNKAWADFKLAAAERARLIDAYGAEAMRLLRRARAKGVFADPGLLNGLKIDLDFMLLRTRPDCQELLRELERKPPPPASGGC
jgi:hypothetical protein